MLVFQTVSRKVTLPLSLLLLKSKKDQAWWCMLLIPSLKRQRQADLSEVKANLVNRMSTRTVKAVWRMGKEKEMTGKPSKMKTASYTSFITATNTGQ